MKDQNDISVWRRVLQQFSLPSVADMTFEEVSAGFSGAKIVCVSAGDEVYALRGWPNPSLPRQRIQELHRYLSFLKIHELPVAVPHICLQSHASLIEESGFLWQVEPWLDGTTKDKNSLTTTERQSMMQTLAKLHLASSQYVALDAGQEWFGTRHTTVPAIRERLSLTRKWNDARIQKCCDALEFAPVDIRDLSKLILELYRQYSLSIAGELQQLSNVICPLFPCWRDLWRDHVLFENEKVTGLIDASATRFDHVGTDLSRLLGSFFEDDKEQWKLALEEYSEVRQLTATDLAIINALDRSSVLLSGMTWVNRWEQRRISESKIASVVERLVVIERRMSQL